MQGAHCRGVIFRTHFEKGKRDLEICLKGVGTPSVRGLFITRRSLFVEKKNGKKEERETEGCRTRPCDGKERKKRIVLRREPSGAGGGSDNQVVGRD